MSDIEKFVAFKKSRFGSFYTVKTTYFAVFVLFKKHDFVLKISLHVRLSVEKYTTRQILTGNKYNASDFDLKKIQRVRY